MRSSWLALCETPGMPKLPQTLQENSYFSKTKATIFTTTSENAIIKEPFSVSRLFSTISENVYSLKNLLFIAPSQLLLLLIIANTVIKNNNKLL